jgi:hypothetical protein
MLRELEELFPCETENCRRNVEALVRDSVSQIGEEETV